MTSQKSKKKNKPVLLGVGSIVLIAGITLVLVWWGDVVALFRGFIGMALALAGLFMLYMVKE